MISIIIATKNRPTEIVRCIISLLDSAIVDFEIIVIDQSTSDDTKNHLLRIQNKHIVYIQDTLMGKSHALNTGFIHAKNDMLAFTDDDCIVSKQWIPTIIDSFIRHPSVSAVFGQTKPYTATKRTDAVCPSVFSVSGAHIISTPRYHATGIGFGNNMAIRKSAFKKLGGFRDWLGPGSIGLTAEDADIALRLLTSGHLLYSNPQMLVFHNRWITHAQARRQELMYAGGEMACYGYFYFQGCRFAGRIVKKSCQKEIRRLSRSLFALFTLPWKRGTIGTLYWSFVVGIYRIWGMGIGWYFSKVQPIGSTSATTHA